MLQTLRIWKWTAKVDNDYRGSLFSNLIDNWPWRTPWNRISTWKWTYNNFGGKELLRRMLERVRGSLVWYLHTRHQQWMKRELRMTYLRSAIWSKESLARYYEEKADGLDQKVS